MSNILAENLRRLRVERKFTQEQAAERLGVSAQAVSRWECAGSLPDVLLLPEIAKLYGVTVDDLYRENAPAYRNYAVRLLSVYESSGRVEDFVLAEREFRRLLATDERTADDLRCFGILHEYMMLNCAKEAERLLDEAIALAADSDDETTCHRARTQKILLLTELGRGAESIETYAENLEQNRSDPKAWLLLIAAHYCAKEYDRALALVRDALELFPDNASLCIYGGDACRELKRYDEAFAYWNAALERDDAFLDARYSMGFCYEELGEYGKAYRAWSELADELERRGLTVEKEFPLRLAAACREKM